MSRSYKKAIEKDSPRNSKKSTEYWRKVRRVQNQVVNQLKYDESIPIPNEKVIINDNNYSDYTIMLNKDDKNYKKHTRK